MAANISKAAKAELAEIYPSSRTDALAELSALMHTAGSLRIGKDKDERLRKKAHLAICIIFTLFIFLFRAINSEDVLDAIYTLCSYTYGPLLGLFAFGMATKRIANDKAVPYVAIAAPAVCLIADLAVPVLTGYRFGYELLLLNGLITFCGMLAVSRKFTEAASAQ